MKRILIVLCSLALLSSCDFLETKVESNITTNNFFKNTADFDMALTGVYYTFTSVEWDAQHRYGNYFTGFMYWGRIGTDEAFVSSGNNGEDLIGNYTYTPENLFVEKVWFMQYLGIQRANVVIDRLNAYTGDEVSDDDRNRILGEAHFLRAWFYFQLARYYGEVPLVLQETTDISKLSTEKAPLADVYAQVIKDYEIAEELLPVKNTVGHATKYAATALKARAYLQMSGEPLKDKAAAAKAAEACKTVIDSGQYELVTDYFSQFDGKHEHNSEYIFDVEFDNTASNSLYGGQVGTIDGVPHEQNAYWAQVRTYKEMYDKFDPNDLRREAVNAGGHIAVNKSGKAEMVMGDEDYKDNYWVYKFRHPIDKSERGDTWANWCNNINFPIIRYADVLLMYAEAENRANGSPSAESLECVNQVRRRGFGKDIHTPDPSVDLKMSSGSAFDEVILNERSLELCFEGHRWADLVRFGKLQEAFRSVGNDPKFKSYYDVVRDNCKDKHSIFPIPQSVIDASDGAITQNPLWQ